MCFSGRMELVSLGRHITQIYLACINTLDNVVLFGTWLVLSFTRHAYHLCHLCAQTTCKLVVSPVDGGVGIALHAYYLYLVVRAQYPSQSQPNLRVLPIHSSGVKFLNFCLSPPAHTWNVDLRRICEPKQQSSSNEYDGYNRRNGAIWIVALSSLSLILNVTLPTRVPRVQTKHRQQYLWNNGEVLQYADPEDGIDKFTYRHQ